jgi:plastocyanin
VQTHGFARRSRSFVGACAALVCWLTPAMAQQTVTIHAVIRSAEKPKEENRLKREQDVQGGLNASEVVVWLKAVDPAVAVSMDEVRNRGKFQLVQHNKTFHPHVLVVPVGSLVDFPNHDPFFHNVFSLFDGKRFDLGLYEAGATNSVIFDRVGVSFLFCNIHPEMSAVVIAVDTPYFGISGRSGNISIANVPEGKYVLHVWYERGVPEDLKDLTRTITISAASRELGAVNILENPNFSPAHKNKYGQDYEPPSTPAYSRP